MQIQCLICSDIVSQAENIYVTKCGHLFHHLCLSQWIERSRTCPQCRCGVSASGMFRIYPTAAGGASGAGGEDAAALQARLDDAQLQLRQQRQALTQLEARVKEAQDQADTARSQVVAVEKKLLSAQSAVAALREQLTYLKVQNKETERLRQENEALQKNIHTLNALERVLNATAEEVDQMLQGYTDVRTIATFATALKRALCESESQKSESRDAARQARETARQANDAARQASAQLAAEKARVQHLQELLDRQSARVSKRPRVSPPESEPECRSEPAECSSAAEPALTPAKSPLVSKPAAANPHTSTMSPYLSLRASALPLAALRHDQLRLKPSELSLVKSSRSTIGRGTHSIFGGDKAGGAVQGGGGRGGQYDGLGGRAREEHAAGAGAAGRAGGLPRRGARHRLRRPPAPAPPARDIADMFNQIREQQS